MPSRPTQAICSEIKMRLCCIKTEHKRSEDANVKSGSTTAVYIKRSTVSCGRRYAHFNDGGLANDRSSYDNKQTSGKACTNTIDVDKVVIDN